MRRNQVGVVKSVPARRIPCAKALRQKRPLGIEEKKEGPCEWKAREGMEEELRKVARSHRAEGAMA